MRLLSVLIVVGVLAGCSSGGDSAARTSVQSPSSGTAPPAAATTSSTPATLDLDGAQRGLLRAIAATPKDTSDAESSKVPCPLGTGQSLLAAAGLPATVSTTYTGSDTNPSLVGCGFQHGPGVVRVIAARADYSEIPDVADLRVEKPLYGGELRLKETAADPSASPGADNEGPSCSATWAPTGRRVTLVLDIQSVSGTSETSCGPALEKLIPVIVANLAKLG